MPGCTAPRVPFRKPSRREVDVCIDGGDVSPDGGSSLLRQVERRPGLLKAVAKLLPDPRNPVIFHDTVEQPPGGVASVRESCSGCAVRAVWG